MRPRAGPQGLDLAIVSDLHLSAGRDRRTKAFDRKEDFFFDESFGRFLDRLASEGESRGRHWRLVIAGDMADFLQVDMPGERIFCWGRVPGADEERLRGLLRDRLSLDWAERAELKKTGIGESLNLSSGEEWARVRLDRERSRATIRTSDGRVRYLPVRQEGGELAVHAPDPAFFLRESEHEYGFSTSPAKTVWKMRVMMDGHWRFFQALGRFIARGNACTIVSGNHDVEWTMPEVQAAFREEMRRYLPPRTGEPAAAERIEFSPWFYYEPGLIWVEHGHQYEDMNSFDWLLSPYLPERRLFRWEDVAGGDAAQLKGFAKKDLGIAWAERALVEAKASGDAVTLSADREWLRVELDGGGATLSTSDGRRLALLVRERCGGRDIVLGGEELVLPSGSLFVRYLFNKVEQTDPFADNVKPLSAYIWSRYCLRQLFSWEFPRVFTSFWRTLDKARQFSGEERRVMQVREDAALEAEAERSGVDAATLRRVRGLWAPCVLYNRGKVSNVLSFVGYGPGVARDLADILFRRRGARSYLEAAAEVQRALGVRYVVFGHTHEPDLAPLSADGRAEYANAGTWTKSFSSDIGERLLRDEQEMAFVQVLRGEGDRLELMRWRDELGRGERLSLISADAWTSTRRSGTLPAALAVLCASLLPFLAYSLKGGMHPVAFSLAMLLPSLLASFAVRLATGGGLRTLAGGPDEPSLALVGVLGSAVPLCLLATLSDLALPGPTLAVLLLLSSFAVSFAFRALVLDERASGWHVLAVLAVAGGAALALRADPAPLSSGWALALLVPLSWWLALLVGRLRLRHLEPHDVLDAQLLYGTLALLVGGLLLAPPGALLTPPGLGQAAAIAAASLACCFLQLSFWYAAISRMELGRATALTMASPALSFVAFTYAGASAAPQMWAGLTLATAAALSAGLMSSERQE